MSHGMFSNVLHVKYLWVSNWIYLNICHPTKVCFIESNHLCFFTCRVYLDGLLLPSIIIALYPWAKSPPCRALPSGQT
jgi:hypothetical protein